MRQNPNLVLVFIMDLAHIVGSEKGLKKRKKRGKEKESEESAAQENTHTSKKEIEEMEQWLKKHKED